MKNFRRKFARDKVCLFTSMALRDSAQSSHRINAALIRGGEKMSINRYGGGVPCVTTTVIDQSKKNLVKGITDGMAVYPRHCGIPALILDC